MTLCEYVVDVAEQEATRQLTSKVIDLATKISDEIIETAEEYELSE